MNKIFSNPEVKKHIILAIIFQLIFTSVIVIYFNIYTNQINNRIIEQNTAIIGKISTLEIYDINKYIDIITKETPQEFVDEGRTILSKYGYNENLKIANQPILTTQKNFYDGLWFIGIILCIPICILILIQYRIIYSKIKRVTAVTERVLEGDKEIGIDLNQEGSIGILAHRISQLNTKVRTSFDDLNKDKQKLKETISDISHQLKTPLSSLSLYNELLLNSKDMKEEERMEFLQQTSIQLQRMEWLTISLLKMARFDAGAIEFGKEKVCLTEPCKKAIDSLAVLADLNDCKINLIEDKKACITGDINWLCEAITNIIKNSIEHTQNNGEVTVSVSKTPLFSRITIYDNGPGIDKKDLPHIFKRFYKGKSSVKPQSIGIGLALSKIIIEEHQGTIYAGNRKQGGAEFQITFLNKM